MRKHRQNSLFRSLFLTNIIFILFTVLVATVTISIETYRFNLREKGRSRIDVLQQICESNTVSRQSIVNLMNTVYDDFYPFLTAEASEAGNSRIQSQLDDLSRQISKLGINSSIDIVMNDKRFFTMYSSERNVKYLTSTYWYIKHYTGETDTSWNFRFSDTNERSDHGLSYGRTVYDKDHRSIGVIVITSDSPVLIRALNEMNRYSVVYILDSNGIYISHSNLNRIGNWGANMAAFEKDYGYNSYNIITRNNKRVMLSNYHDPESGWTFVEEQSIDSLLEGTIHMLERCFVIIFIGTVIFILIAYLRVKNNTDALKKLTSQIAEVSVNDLKSVDVDRSYEEISILSETFNEMLAKKEELIREIQIREAEKRKTEYDFLQAQVDPHFLNNTLLAVRSLLALNETDRAQKMMIQLVELLHVPANPNIQFIPLKDELHLGQDYLDIMDNRTDRKTEFIIDASPESLEYLVPRLITQPVLGNAVFHGFANKNDDCRICVKTETEGNCFKIHIRDNGRGISEKRLAEVISGNYRSQAFHHGIGLNNIRRRLEIIFGGASGIRILSDGNSGTTVTLIMDNYQERSRSFAENIETLNEEI